MCSQKVGNARTYKRTNRHFDKSVNIWKNTIFSMFTYYDIFGDQNVMVSAVFEVLISKKRSKKTLFSWTITILDHTRQLDQLDKKQSEKLKFIYYSFLSLTIRHT